MKVSILASVYNEEKTLKPFLDGVFSQTIPSGVEVELLVCNDASTDESGDILNQALYEERDLSLRVIHNTTNVGQAVSINRLFKIAKGSIVVFIDGDAIAQKNWLMNLIEPVLSGRAEIVQGNYWTQYGARTLVVSEHEKWRRSASLRRFGNTDETVRTVNTRNFAIAADLLREVHERFGYILNPHATCGADTELGLFLSGSGHKIVLKEDAVVAHDDPATLRGILRQKMHHGFHDGLLGISYPNNMYYAVYYPFIHDRVSLFFSIPVALAFTLANSTGLLLRALRPNRAMGSIA